MPSFSRSVFLLIFLISSNARAVFGCNDGSLNVAWLGSYTCCAQALSAGWDYRITTSSNDHFTARVYETSTSTTYYTSTACQVRSSGSSCTGSACLFTSSNTCDADTNGVVSSITPSMLCLKITCDNALSGCSFNTVSAAFYTSTPSPPPPAVVPSPPPATASNTGDCECQCCSTNYCTRTVVGSFNAGSSAACTANACRTQFSSSCPAATSPGSVSSEYTASTSTTTTTLSGTATSGTQNHRIQALCLSALTVCVTLLV